MVARDVCAAIEPAGLKLVGVVEHLATTTARSSRSRRLRSGGRLASVFGISSCALRKAQYRHSPEEPVNAEKVRSLGWCGRNLRALAQGGNLPATKGAVATILSQV
jgi:hypothetical protein